MENQDSQKIKRGRGRPKVFSDEERKNHKTTYMLNKEWYCDICKMGRNYTLAGKHCHLNTKIVKRLREVEVGLKSIKQKKKGEKLLKIRKQNTYWVNSGIVTSVRRDVITH